MARKHLKLEVEYTFFPLSLLDCARGSNTPELIRRVILRARDLPEHHHVQLHSAMDDQLAVLPSSSDSLL